MKTWIAGGLVLLAGSMPVYAQFKNILLDSARSEAGRYPLEPSIAISYKNPNIMVAGSAFGNIYYTSDGGTSWEKSVLRTGHGVSGNTVVMADFSGNFYHFHTSGTLGNDDQGDLRDRIVMQKSKDGGKTWDARESINHSPSKYLDKPWVAIDRKGNLYTTWTQFDKRGSDDPACESKILFSKSSSGSKWSKPLQISMTPGDCKGDDNTLIGGVPTVTNDGKLFVVWSHQEIIILDRSLNGGDTWLTNDIGLIEQPGGWNMNIPGINQSSGMPILVCDNSKGLFSGALYVVWADQQNGKDDTDIWFMRSFNYGDNWTTPVRINDDEGGRHQFMPWMTVDAVSGHIYVVFYDRREYDDERTDVYLAYSTDNGSTFKNVKISDTPFKPQADIPFSNYTHIAAYNGVIVPVWTRMDDGSTGVWTSVIRFEDLEDVPPPEKPQKRKR